MGAVSTIAADRFPKQTESLKQPVDVCFHYDTSKVLGGTIVRDDAEEPWKTIILLEDGRVILGTECQYRPGSVQPKPGSGIFISGA